MPETMTPQPQLPSTGQNAAPPPRPVDSAWSLKIATIAGIPIRLHFTFLLFLLWIGLAGRNAGNGLSLFYVLAVFLCVALHELGHSLVALRYKIPVADITLYPIGGIARIEKRPTARQELWIALAGPAVNVVIALVLWAALGFVQWATITVDLTHVVRGMRPFWERVLLANVTLAVFNLIPAFPMDGGRVLRAILALNMPAVRATAIAAGVGQFIAIAVGIMAFLSQTPNWSLIFIAFFVYLGAGQEAFAYKQEALGEGALMRQAMITDYRTLTTGTTLKEAADVLLATSQHDFPVMLGDMVQGVLTRNDLLRGLSQEGPGAYVAGAMQRDFMAAGPEDNLSDALPRLQGQSGPLLVLDGERLLGMVTGENVQEFFAIRQIAARRAPV